jgi:hypothetical protein
MSQLRAMAFAIAFGLVLLTIPGLAAAASGPLLALDPSKGPPGTTVRVTPILTASPGECVALWDGQEVARFTCGADPNGLILWTKLAVPAAAAPGEHTVTVCRLACGGIDPTWQQSSPFTVLAVVPDLGKLSLPEAVNHLKTASLTLGSVQGPSSDPAARVVGQDPPPGTAVDPGTMVNVTVAVPPPVLVRVPDLLGHTRAQAEALAANSQLVLRVRSGSGRVDSQDPQPGSQVPPGTAVTVTLTATPLPALVAVPDLRHRTLDEAEAAVRAVGLVLQSRGAPIGTVETQQPAPGTRVPRGSTVTVTITAPTASTPNTTPTAALPSATFAAIAVVLALAALVTSTLWRPRGRRSRKWVRQHVRVVPDAVAGETDTGETGPRPTRAVGLEPHPDHGSQTLEEAHR